LLTDTLPCANVRRFATGIVTVAKKHPPVDLEKALKELEALVEKMEQGDLPLEESLQHFERGIQLTRQCQKALLAAEQKVQILLDKGDSTEVKPFSDED
jgi:exodeoxyribonuclease VII small subunit